MKKSKPMSDEQSKAIIDGVRVLLGYRTLYAAWGVEPSYTPWMTPAESGNIRVSKKRVPFNY